MPKTVIINGHGFNADYAKQAGKTAWVAEFVANPNFYRGVKDPTQREAIFGTDYDTLVASLAEAPEATAQVQEPAKPAPEAAAPAPPEPAKPVGGKVVEPTK